MTRATPQPARFAAFYKLVDKKVIAGQLCRYARAVELAAQASVDAEALFGGNSLVVAELHMSGCDSLNSSAVDASGAEKEALRRQTWAELLSVVAFLLRRLEGNTLLPGTIREEELHYEAHSQAVAKKEKNEPVLPPALLRTAASSMGYRLLLCAVYLGLNHLPFPSPAAEQRCVESFVLQSLDVVPRTAGIQAGLALNEADIVAFMEKYMNIRFFEPAFCTAVLRKWRSVAVSSVLQARGVLQSGVAASEQDNARACFEARQRADIAKHGLRDCALSSCAKTEKTVKEFAGCSGCRSVVYCCLEHQARWTGGRTKKLAERRRRRGARC